MTAAGSWLPIVASDGGSDSDNLAAADGAAAIAAEVATMTGNVSLSLCSNSTT